MKGLIKHGKAMTSIPMQSTVLPCLISPLVEAAVYGLAMFDITAG